MKGIMDITLHSKSNLGVLATLLLFLLIECILLLQILLAQKFSKDIISRRKSWLFFYFTTTTSWTIVASLFIINYVNTSSMMIIACSLVAVVAFIIWIFGFIENFGSIRIRNYIIFKIKLNEKVYSYINRFYYIYSRLFVLGMIVLVFLLDITLK